MLVPKNESVFTSFCRFFFLIWDVLLCEHNGVPYVCFAIKKSQSLLLEKTVVNFCCMTVCAYSMFVNF